jgi:prophage regulatory protein
VSMTTLNQPSADRIVREAERKAITSISRTTAWSLERKGLFPKRRQLYPQSTSVGWLLSELTEWVGSRHQLIKGEIKGEIKMQNNHLAMYLDDNRLVKKPEIQKLLGISPSTLTRRVKRGQFPPPALIQNGRSSWRFKDLHEWLSNR